MKPKDKAQELKDKFGDLAPDVVDEILGSMPTNPSNFEHGNIYDDMTESMKYWRQVKKEHEK